MEKTSNVKDIEVKVEKEEWEKYLDKAFNKVKKEININGFRKGKISREIFNKKVGVERLYQDAIDFAADAEYKKIIDNYKPIIRPTLDIKEVNEETVTLVFTITEKPIIKLGDYKNLGVKKDKVEVTDEEVNEKLNNLREEYAEIVVKDGAAENGDTIIIDYKSYIDGKEFNEGNEENYELTLGSNIFIPGFEEGLVGLKKDDEKELNLSFPEDYFNEELTGKDVVFKVKVNEVKEKRIPELNEEFFEDLDYENISTEEELKNKIKEEIKDEKQKEADDKFSNELVNKLIEVCTIEGLPDELINQETEQIYNQYKSDIEYNGYKMDMYLKITQQTEDDVKKILRPLGERRVKSSFIYEEVAIAENIEITDAEIEEEINKEIEEYEIPRDVVEKYYKSDYAKENMKVKKAADLIIKLNDKK